MGKVQSPSQIPFVAVPAARWTKVVEERRSSRPAQTSMAGLSGHISFRIQLELRCSSLPWLRRAWVLLVSCQVFPRMLVAFGTPVTSSPQVDLPTGTSILAGRKHSALSAAPEHMCCPNPPHLVSAADFSVITSTNHCLMFLIGTPDLPLC